MHSTGSQKLNSILNFSLLTVPMLLIFFSFAKFRSEKSISLLLEDENNQKKKTNVQWKSRWIDVNDLVWMRSNLSRTKPLNSLHATHRNLKIRSIRYLFRSSSNEISWVLLCFVIQHKFTANATKKNEFVVTTNSETGKHGKYMHNNRIALSSELLGQMVLAFW